MDKTKNKTQAVNMVIGPFLFLLSILLLPDRSFPFQSRVVIGTVLWMSYWWITTPVTPAITAFLPIIVNALFSVAPMESIIKSYASDIVFLLAGANLISITWEETGVDKRLALKTLALIGPSVKQQAAVWLLTATAMSAVLPNAVVVAVLTPIAVSMLKYIGEKDIGKSDAANLILLAIAWGANNGGMATPLGGAMNLVSIQHIENFTGTEFVYTDWIVKMAPFTVLITLLTLIYILNIPTSKKSLKGSKEYFCQLIKQLPKTNRDEMISLGLFVVSAVLSFSRQLYKSLLSDLKPAYVFFICGFLTFFINKKDGKKFLKWEAAKKNLIWDLIFLFAGGTALGAMVNESKASQLLAELISKTNVNGGFMTIFIMVTIIVILSDVINNTSAAAVSIPIIIGIASGIGQPVIPYVFIASAAYNASYTLPTSIRAVPIGYGLSPCYMFWKGLFLTGLVIAGISVTGYLLLLG